MTIYYEKLNTDGFLFDEIRVAVSVLTADFGDGYGDGVLIGSPDGLRSWNLKIETLPDQAGFMVDANARAKITLVSQPNNNDTMTIGGKTYTFKTSSPSGDQILVGSEAIATALNIVAKVNADTATTLCTSEANGAIVELMANTAGVGGNSIALATDGTRLTKVAFANGRQTRAAYLWNFFLRSKVKGNRPFQVEDPMDVTGATVLYAEFVDPNHELSYGMLCSAVYSTGLQLRQRRV